MIRDLLSLCPRCKKESIFIGVTKLKDSCNKCGLGYKPENIGDGASYLTTFLLCFIITPTILYIEIRYSISFLLYLFVVFPITLILSIILLRITRYLLIKKNYDIT
jgi:uncharacterized protein (DUF983 family)